MFFDIVIPLLVLIIIFFFIILGASYTITKEGIEILRPTILGSLLIPFEDISEIKVISRLESFKYNGLTSRLLGNRFFGDVIVISIKNQKKVLITPQNPIEFTKIVNEKIKQLG